MSITKSNQTTSLNKIPKTIALISAALLLSSCVDAQRPLKLTDPYKGYLGNTGIKDVNNPDAIKDEKRSQ
jgi:hypothetical protein